MNDKKSIPPEAFEKLKAVRELTLRGVGGERENAKKIYRRKLAEHGHTEASFEGAHRDAVPESPPEEPLPASLRTIYVSGELTVNIVHGGSSRLVRDRTCGVLLRAGTLTLAGSGTVTVTLAEPFRTLYASGCGALSVSGFSFKDVSLHQSGAGTLTVSGAAIHATLAPSAGSVEAAQFSVNSLRITASGKSTVSATARCACITASGHAGVRVAATHSATATVDAGAKVVVSGCPVSGRSPVAGPGQVRWAQSGRRPGL